MTTAIAESSSALANHFTGFSISVSGSGTNDFENESMYISVGDGTDTYIWFWTDTNNHHGMIADSELEPFAKLSNYDNDNLMVTNFRSKQFLGFKMLYVYFEGERVIL